MVYCLNSCNSAIWSDDTLKTASEDLAAVDNVAPAHEHPFSVNENAWVANNARPGQNLWFVHIDTRLRTHECPYTGQIQSWRESKWATEGSLEHSPCQFSTTLIIGKINVQFSLQFKNLTVNLPGVWDSECAKKCQCERTIRVSF